VKTEPIPPSVLAAITMGSSAGSKKSDMGASGCVGVEFIRIKPFLAHPPPPSLVSSHFWRWCCKSVKRVLSLEWPHSVSLLFSCSCSPTMKISLLKGARVEREDGREQSDDGISGSQIAGRVDEAFGGFPEARSELGSAEDERTVSLPGSSPHTPVVGHGPISKHSSLSIRFGAQSRTFVIVLKPLVQQLLHFLPTVFSSCLIADEPGLGKTIQAIGVAWCFKDEWPLLVIAPSSARYHWQKEVVKWLRDAKGKPLVTEGQVQVMTGGGQPITKGESVHL
jgi:hypothetical protein